LPTFVTFDLVNKNFTISPNDNSNVGIFTINIILSDYLLTNSYSFNITVKQNT